VRFAVLALVVLVAALFQYGPAQVWNPFPDLVLACAAWAIVAGREEELLPRAWLIGGIADLVDPASAVFHLIFFAAAALAFVPLRPFLFHSHASSLALGAVLLLCAEYLMVGLVGGWWAALDGGWFAVAGLTVAAAIALGWLFEVIPEGWHPLGRLRA